MLEEVLKIRTSVIPIHLCLATVMGCATPNDHRLEQLIRAVDFDQVSVSPCATHLVSARIKLASTRFRLANKGGFERTNL